ncbi:hypothetical protein HELRODRAFT_175240 [Helobdella robusta]|uniref:Uncharacterized protein n=1 Tax=Helobdella robusta TaxID=6412 RepID=T1F921_HELRO|nr:hypothetical protein HELRODRAFT_175240 [Helobdella robusta]ESO00762.1 hypothetical protein HELRODRAFT_175240 [Helobdella robusta]
MEVTDQWFGATVVSQNKKTGRVMVCAPRYRNYKTHLVRGEGRCILMTNNLRAEMYIEPCRNRAISDGYSMFAHCQAGFGTDITENDEVLVGAPGSINWKGMSFFKSISNDIEVYVSETLYKHVPEISNSSQLATVPSFSYLGWCGGLDILGK